ncbi:uncharacterized protein LOC119662565 [Teleopsis dalmanni]|uniref:uncharacterized protein LOC119662565 n=1 Tax=Teleopsis dalmanni TaxID=139649 RepID=UPI0018CD8904|nr:uncharacterized protein LOC119662565 [Teleopsis dalmanni]
MNDPDTSIKSSLDEAIRETTLMSSLLDFNIKESKPRAIQMMGKLMTSISRVVPGMENIIPKLVESLNHQEVDIRIKSILAILRISARTIKGPNLLKTEDDSFVDINEICNIESNTYDLVFQKLQEALILGQMSVLYLVKQEIFETLLVVIRSSHIKRRHIHVIALMLYYTYHHSVELSDKTGKDLLHLFQVLLTVVDKAHMKWILKGLRGLVKHPKTISLLLQTGILNTLSTLIVHKDDDVKKDALRLFVDISTNVYIKNNPYALRIPLNNVLNLLTHTDENIRRYCLEVLHSLTVVNNGLVHRVVHNGLVPLIIHEFDNSNRTIQYIVIKVIKNISVYGKKSDIVKLIDENVIPLLCQSITQTSSKDVYCALTSIYNILKIASECTELALRECKGLEKIEVLKHHEDISIKNLIMKLQEDFPHLFEENVSEM